MCNIVGFETPINVPYRFCLSLFEMLFFELSLCSCYCSLQKYKYHLVCVVLKRCSKSLTFAFGFETVINIKRFPPL